MVVYEVDLGVDDSADHQRRNLIGDFDDAFGFLAAVEVIDDRAQ